jgi:hypothetical protein
MLNFLSDVMLAVRLHKAEHRPLTVSFRIARDRRRHMPAWAA